MSVDNWLEYGIDVQRRTILLGSAADAGGAEAGIDWQASDRVIKGLHLMRGDRSIRLILNSFGGEDDHARAIIAAIRMHPADIHGIVMGRAESAAAWILQCCDWRIMTTHSSLMLHLGTSPKDRHSKYMDKMFVDDVYAKMIEKDPKYPRSKLVSAVSDDWNVYPTQALALGLCDELFK